MAPPIKRMPSVTTIENTGVIALIDDLEPYSGNLKFRSSKIKANFKLAKRSLNLSKN